MGSQGPAIRAMEVPISSLRRSIQRLGPTSAIRILQQRRASVWLPTNSAFGTARSNSRRPNTYACNPCTRDSNYTRIQKSWPAVFCSAKPNKRIPIATHIQQPAVVRWNLSAGATAAKLATGFQTAATTAPPNDTIGGTGRQERGHRAGKRYSSR